MLCATCIVVFKDTSFDSEGTGHFIGEITALTPPSSSKHISPNGKTAVTFEEADDYIGELSVSTPRSSSSPGGKKKRVSFFSDFFSDKVAIMEEEQPADADCSENADEMSDPDMNPEYWCAAPDGLDENKSPTKMEEEAEDSSDNGNDSYDNVPVMDASDPGHGMNDNNGSMDSAKFKHATSDQIEDNFYQFFLAMMLRHLFGSWIPGQWDPATNIFNPKLLLTQPGNGGEKKDFRRMMKLRKLEYNDDKCEVFPQLKREEGSLGELAMIDE